MRILLVISCFFLPQFANAVSLVKKAIEYKDQTKSDGQVFEGYLVYLKGHEKSPAVLVVHDWMGLTERTKARADQLAELGYVALALDIYGKGVRPHNPEEAAAEATKYKSNRVLYREHLNLGIKVLNEQKIGDPKRLAAIGYCFGGTGVVEFARSGANLKAIVSFHGGLDSPTPADGKNIKSRVLALHGADDPFVPAPDLAAFESEMKTNKIDWQLVKYGGAVHSFTDKSAGNDNSKGAAYNADADRRSWDLMKTFLTESL